MDRNTRPASAALASACDDLLDLVSQLRAALDAGFTDSAGHLAVRLSTDAAALADAAYSGAAGRRRRGVR